MVFDLPSLKLTADPSKCWEISRIEVGRCTNQWEMRFVLFSALSRAFFLQRENGKLRTTGLHGWILTINSVLTGHQVIYLDPLAPKQGANFGGETWPWLFQKKNLAWWNIIIWPDLCDPKVKLGKTCSLESDYILDTVFSHMFLV